MAVLAALACAGCPGPALPDPTDPARAGPTRSDAARCEVTLPVEEPTLGSPAVEALPRSQWATRVDVALSRLRAELDRGLPVELAKGSGQSPGSPGRVSYSVRRSGLELRIAKDELLVDVPVVGQATACVSIGPLCPSVGSCSPALLVTAHVPLDLGPDLALRAKSVDIEMTRGCVIAGVDASSRIRSGASGYSEKVRQRINEILPTIRPEVEAAWRGLHAEVPLAGDRCALPRPERVVERALESSATTLSFAVAIEGWIEPVTSCGSAPSPSPAALPKASRLPELASETRLAGPQSIDWASLASALDRSLTAAGPPSAASVAPRLGPLRVLEVRPAAATANARGALALRVGLQGSHCGEIWLVAQPVLGEDGSAVRLEAVAIAPGQTQRASLVAGAGIEPWVARHAQAALGPSSDALAKHGRAIIEQASRRRSTEPKVLPGEPVRAPGSIAFGADGLVLLDAVRFAPSVRIE